MKIHELVDDSSTTLDESSFDAKNILGQVAADYATAKGYPKVGATIGATSQALSGDYLGAASTTAQAAGQKKLGGILGAASTAINLTPIGIALDLVNKVTAKDPLFAEKIKDAAFKAKQTGAVQTISHPISLLGPLNIIPQLTKLFTNQNMEVQLQVDPQGRVLTTNNNFLNNS